MSSLIVNDVNLGNTAVPTRDYNITGSNGSFVISRNGVQILTAKNSMILARIGGNGGAIHLKEDTGTGLGPSILISYADTFYMYEESAVRGAYLHIPSLTASANGALYHQGNILGAGSILEKGSNANGDYTKFVGGRVIITKKVPANIGNTITLYYPVTLVETPNIIATGLRPGGTSPPGIRIRNQTATSFRLDVTDGNDNYFSGVAGEVVIMGRYA